VGRSALAVASAVNLKRTNSSRIALEGGFGLQNTEYRERPSENNMVAIIGADIYAFRFKKHNLTIKPILLPNISDPGRVRFNLNADYKIQIVSDLWWNISFYGNWDSRPPSGLRGVDYGTSMGINYSFH
jgi:hypothetical protein